jgi:hypothetical protein
MRVVGRSKDFEVLFAVGAMLVVAVFILAWTVAPYVAALWVTFR